MEPNNQTNKSDIARLRAEIEIECESLKLFTAPAMKASHKIISNSYKALDNKAKELGKLIGDDKAMEAVCEAYNKLVK